MIRPHLNGWAPPFIAAIKHDPLVRRHQVNFTLPIDKRDGFREGIDTLVDTFYGDALKGRETGANGSGKSKWGIQIDFPRMDMARYGEDAVMLRHAYAATLNRPNSPLIWKR